jgi:hypothetical protein
VDFKTVGGKDEKNVLDAMIQKWITCYNHHGGVFNYTREYINLLVKHKGDLQQIAKELKPEPLDCEKRSKSRTHGC